MNIPLVLAALLILLACIVHTFMGDRELRQLRPERNPDVIQGANPHFSYWLTARCVFHMASVDLLASGVLILLIGLGVIPYSLPLALFIAGLYLAYLIAWLLVLRLSGASKRDYRQQGQWILFLLILVLLAAGILMKG